MAETLRQIESAPAQWPIVSGLSMPAYLLSQGAIWQRIEAFVAWRFAVREVVWHVEGAGLWHAPLAPVVAASVEVWQGGAWQECHPTASSWGGYDLPSFGPYRIMAMVGAEPVPELVAEAFRRLAEYCGDLARRARGGFLLCIHDGANIRTD